MSRPYTRPALFHAPLHPATSVPDPSTSPRLLFSTYRRFFDTRLDLDGDGRVTEDEVVAYVADPLEAFSDDQRSHAVFAASLVDADGDGVITWPEFASKFARLDPSDRYVQGLVRGKFGGGRGVGCERERAVGGVVG